MGRILFQALYWIFRWFYYVAIICFVGAMLGVVTHFLFAFFFRENPDYAYFLSFGFTNGLRYGGVWAGGMSIVLCVMRAHKLYQMSKKVESIEEGAS